MLYQEWELSHLKSSLETKNTWTEAQHFCTSNAKLEMGNQIPLKGDPPVGSGEAPFHPLGKVLPENGMGYTLFTNVKVALNNVVIDSGSVLYPYRGDFETRLFNSKDVKEGSLQLMGFDEEVMPFDDVRDVAADFPWEDVAEGTTEPNALAHAALNRRYK